MIAWLWAGVAGTLLAGEMPVAAADGAALSGIGLLAAYELVEPLPEPAPAFEFVAVPKLLGAEALEFGAKAAAAPANAVPGPDSAAPPVATPEPAACASWLLAAACCWCWWRSRGKPPGGHPVPA